MKKAVIALLLVGGLVFIAANFSGKRAIRLRVMAFNAEWLVHTPEETDMDPWGARFTLNEHFERVAGVIESLNPDIITIVEVTSEDALQHLVKILADKGMDDYVAYHIESNDSGTGQDIGFITRHQPDAVDGKLIHQFYSRNRGEVWREDYTIIRRGTTRHKNTSVSKNALCYFTVNGYKLGLLGLHFIARPNHKERNAKRQAQARVTQKIIRTQIVDKGYVPIVLGDMNDYDGEVDDRCGSKPMTTVLKQLKDYDANLADNELVNAATLVNRKFDRYTSHWDKNRNGIPDATDAMTMIDHVLLHKTLVEKVNRVFIDHGHGSQTSDHWPIIVDLVLD